MLSRTAWIMAVLACLSGCATRDLPDRMTGWDIVVAPDAPPAVKYAAQEFRTFFAQAAGLSLPIRTDAPPGSAGHVYIGPGPALGASRLGLKTADLGEEDLRVTVRASAVGIAGGSPRATLYGVYAFLENQLGVRFLAPDCTHVPPLDLERGLSPASYTFRPALAYRNSYYGPNQADPVFAARMRQNAATDDPRLGGRTAWQQIGHTLHLWVPVRVYGKEHPEYFAEIDGRRYADGPDDHGRDGTQLCFTNPEVKKIVTAKVLELLAEEPGRVSVALGQNDTLRYCQCENCRAILEREGTPMGPLLAMANEVADAVGEKHPGVKIGVLAYQAFRTPPKHLKPRGNVAVEVCSIEACLLHPVDDPGCPDNAAFRKDLEEWARITPNLYVWSYAVNFLDYLSPCPDLRPIGPNIRFFAAQGAKGVFMQGAGYARSTELADLRNYLICNLLWDPGRDASRLMEEFLTLYYGRAADPIREYVRLIHDNAQAKGIHKNCYGFPSQYGIDAQVVARGKELFARALRLAGNDAVRRRVEKASIAVVRAGIEPLIHWIQGRPRGTRLPAGLEPLRPRTEEFLALCRKHQVNRVNEEMTLDQLDALYRAATGSGPD